MHERVPLLSKSIYVTTLLVHIALCVQQSSIQTNERKKNIILRNSGIILLRDFECVCVYVYVFVCVFELVLFLELRDTLKNVLKLKMLCFKRDFFCSHMRQRIYFIAKWNEPSKHCYCLSLAQ